MPKPNAVKVVSSLNSPEVENLVEGMSDEDIQKISFLFPSSSQSITGSDSARPAVDADGFPISFDGTDYASFSMLQRECWNKYIKNPQINAYIRDYKGNLTGYGYGCSSHVYEINDVIEAISEDPRNDLIQNMTKYVARAEIEGELFLNFTLHNDGFVEIDFVEPSSLKSDGDKNSGIIFHPKKPTMPLAYLFEVSTATGTEIHAFPSIYIAYYPELWSLVSSHKSLKGQKLILPRKSGKSYKKIGGFNSFTVAWDRGCLTPRNVSHIRTTLEWLEHYENLKKYEIDHKKSSGAYLWIGEFADLKAFRLWMALTPEQKADTGLMATKTPGGTLMVPPGITIRCINPQLTKISESDTDILRMVVAGLNRPEDMVTGVTSGSTFSGVNASRGPQADRIADELAYFERYLTYDFWRAVFFLHSKASDFPELFRVQEVTDFDKSQEPVFRWVKKQPHKLISIDFPQSEISDTESKAKSLLGTKHGSVVDTLGLPRGVVAKKLGFGNYRRLRYQNALEENTLPPTLTTVDAESAQEKAEAEPSREIIKSRAEKEKSKKTDKKSGKKPAEKKPKEKVKNNK